LLLGKFEEEGREKLLDTIQTLQVDRHALPAKSSTPNEWVFDQSVCEDEGKRGQQNRDDKDVQNSRGDLKRNALLPGNAGVASNLCSASDARTI
jgi:hypothetical protein